MIPSHGLPTPTFSQFLLKLQSTQILCYGRTYYSVAAIKFAVDPKEHRIGKVVGQTQGVEIINHERADVNRSDGERRERSDSRSEEGKEEIQCEESKFGQKVQMSHRELPP